MPLNTAPYEAGRDVHARGAAARGSEPCARYSGLDDDEHRRASPPRPSPHSEGSEGAGVAHELGGLLREERTEQELLEGDVLLAPRGAGRRLLRHEASGREHAEAAVRELLLLHDAELGGVVGLLVRVGPADLHAVGLSAADAERHREPE